MSHRLDEGDKGGEMRFWIVSAALWGAASVAVGAYGSHALVGDEARALWAETGSFYGLIHALALLAVAALGQSGRGCRKARFLAAGAFWLGLLLFSGGLFIKALADVSLDGPFIPVGGSLFIAGWLILAAYGFTYRQAEK